MRRTTALWAARLLSLAAASASARASPNSSSSSSGISGAEADVSRGAGLFFADRAVKLTRPSSPGLSLSCTPSILSCDAPDAAATVRLATAEPGQVPLAKIQLAGACAVSLLRSNRIAFHCSGEAGRVQRHEVGLKTGDILAVLRGCDRMRGWDSLERTLRSVAGEDLEYTAEEVLLRLASDARAAGGDCSDVLSTGVAAAAAAAGNGAPNGVCIMAVVRHCPSARLPQPPFHLQCSIG
ncbi:uncharacterized protein Tco025E_07431 [Trypanosoma conorhini]|uniref:PPM-type phosphatase domain-containing protein n=1 Tax=Trypanosoma conorhini TaxID=83891 RepID=A0A422NP42_9TRYP|nr:uncharacterized protein Tco025E_07431 [Trypanosoma conorhini]RNF07164.1 hypothetical protein Tco025E_07431 [Trypanosoma conorhini]